MELMLAVVAARPEASPEGFVEDTSIWRMDSARDFQKAIDKKCWHPNNKTKKAMPDLKSICFVLAEAEEHITVTIAARGTNAQTLGQRTTMSLYRNVIIADSVPTVGVTRWVSAILTVGSYKKEFVAWHTNTSKWSLGAWTGDAKLLSDMVKEWCFINQDKFR